MNSTIVKETEVNWGRRVFIGFLVILVLGGLSGVLWLGLQPKPVGKIKLSRFRSGELLAQAVQQRLWDELGSRGLWWLGLDLKDEFQLQFLKEFLREQDPKRSFQEIWVDQEVVGTSFETWDPRMQVFVFRERGRQMLEGLSGSANPSLRRILLVSEPRESTSLQKASLADYLKQHVDVDSLVFSNFPRERSEESQMTFPCETALGESSQYQLGCLVLQKARSLYRKKIEAPEPGERWGFLDQVGLNEYVFAFWAPGLSSRSPAN
ncbi:MAG: hypothetical protein WCH11_01135 [Bdellovibrio sp.]